MFKLKAVFFLSLALICSSVFGQIEISSISEKVLYRADAVDQLFANDKAYLSFPADPVKISAVLIEIKNNSVGYIEVTKVGSIELPDVVDAYIVDPDTKISKYVYEHKGKGTYHIRSTNENGRPVYEKFEIVGSPQDPPPIDPPPTDPPPTDPPVGGHPKLVELVKTRPNDPVTSEILSKAYEAVIPKLLPDTIDRQNASAITVRARRDALLSAPTIKADWNLFLRNVDLYMETITSKKDYIDALRVLSRELGVSQTRAVGEQPPKPVFKILPQEYGSSSNYVPEWSYPGDIDTHLGKPPHSVPYWELIAMSYEEKLIRHDSDHNSMRRTRNFRVFPRIRFFR